MTRVIIILFLLIAPVSAKCKYYATADVENNVLVNKKETYTCKEDENFFIQFITEEKYHRAFTMVFLTLLENL
tara:strand:- start:217 stop:435 length:219 start_codon:yes stop_codon:yes gene_type:complete